uniref:Uncharacterized protein n=1 Tax=Anopheles funestus TaxID=62324 RepID=A0A182S030_ANOFN
MNASPLNTTICNAGQSNNLYLRLPKIELPVFDGDRTKWFTFRDRFTVMTHVSSEIPAVMKLRYLVASLRGEAAARFEYTSITADNYILTWNALLKRYDNKRSLIREYTRALHMMPSIRSECVDSLMQLVDDFICHVKGLEKTRGADGKIVVNLLTSKSKVAYLSIKHTIARLELCAAHLASRLLKAVAASTTSHAKIIHFSNSTTILHWLNASPNTWKTFVANRVSKILQTTKCQQWSHVPDSCNPADLVSRGMKPEQIVHDQLRWHGPEWLAQSEEYCPQVEHSLADLTECENERKQQLHL